MEFWVYMLSTLLLIPIIMTVCGRLFIKRAPKEINYIFGYRTNMSMKNKETWEYAHKFLGKIWCTFGITLLPLSVIPMFFVIKATADTVENVVIVVLILQLVVLIGTIIPIEIALNKRFNKDGTRK